MAALFDRVGIGASKAVKKMGLGNRVVIVGLGAGRDARESLHRGGPFRASVAFFPQSYGERVIAIALKILAGEKVPLTSYTNHVVLTRANLGQYYPASG